MVLQGRQLQALEGARQRSEDRLASAAQVLVAQLQGPSSCLRPLPSSAWIRGALPPECPPELDPDALRRSTVDGSAVELIQWDPAQEPPGLVLQEAEGGRQGRFELRANGLQALGV
jgi:hypothetical protein